tara:strand:- start:6468 stop:7259 length:792 start_codon:yes stop_codon:yes gene_type:complete
MNKYTYGQWTVRCSFCGTKGHNIRSCPHIVDAAKDQDCKHWDAFQVSVAQAEIARREELAQKQLKPRSTPRCGFCGKKKHNRKNCLKLKKTRKQIYRANARWRKKFVERINTLGINEGALIQIKGLPTEAILGGTRQYFSAGGLSPSSHLGVVESYDLVSLNVFCNFLGVWDYRSQASVKAKVTTEKGFVSICLGKFVGEELFYRNAFFPKYGSAKVLTHSQWHGADDWIYEDFVAPIEWLIKTHSMSELEDLKIMTLIEKWT